jgi:hypothetical protein
MILRHEVGRQVEWTETAGEPPRWTYVYGGRPKPYVHPLRTPSGIVLTVFEPHDHVWHRGLWFTFKFVNGENFWEEHPPFGVQAARPPAIAHGENGAVTLAAASEWVRPGGETVLDEARTLASRPLGPGRYAIDWDVRLTPRAPASLDRTPFTTWGGYGGLTFRGSRNWQETRLLFADGSTSDRPAPKPSRWCDLAGKLDGGPGLTGGVAMFDHPDNPRHPVPWYGATGAGHYFNAALLFHGPLALGRGETLRLRYRVLVHDGLPGADDLNAAYEAWLAERPA